MNRRPGATPAARAAATADAIPFAWRLDRHDDPASSTPSTDPAAPPAPATDPGAPPAPATDPAAPNPDPDKPLGPAGEKALAEFKERARKAEADLKAAQAKVAEFEDREKTELERAQGAAAAAEQRAQDAEAALLRQRIINETGLNQELAEFLPTGDEEVVRAAAQKLAAATTPPQSGPRPDPSQGSGRQTAPTDYRTASNDDFKAQLAEHGLRARR